MCKHPSKPVNGAKAEQLASDTICRWFVVACLYLHVLLLKEPTVLSEGSITVVYATCTSLSVKPQ